MATTTTDQLPYTRFPPSWSLADLQEFLGGVPLERIRLNPPPGCATEEDVLRIASREDRLYELDEGVLVEKTVGWYESLLAGLIITELNKFLETNDLGQVLAPDATLRILPGTVKMPDVSFVSWSRFSEQGLARRPIEPDRRSPCRRRRHTGRRRGVVRAFPVVAGAVRASESARAGPLNDSRASDRRALFPACFAYNGCGNRSEHLACRVCRKPWLTTS